MAYSPARIALAGVIAWILIRVLMPLQPITELDWSAMAFIIACYALFWTGCFIADLMDKKAAKFPDPFPIGVLSKTQFLSTMLIGAIGFAFRVIDRVVYRGVDYSLGAADVREALANSSSSVFGIIGSVLMPFCLIPLTLLLGSGVYKRQPILLILAAVVFAMPTVESLGQLSRTVFLMSFFMLGIVVIITVFGGRVARFRLLIPAIVTGVALLMASSFVFQLRLSDYSRDLSDSVVQSAYAAQIRPNEEAMDSLTQGSELVAGTYAALLPNALYFVHGMYEFTVLWDRPDDQKFAYGAYTFAPIAKYIYPLFGVEWERFYDEGGFILRLGVFNTFFGPIWVDFGWAGLIFCQLFGFLVTWLANQVKMRQTHWLPLYSVLATIVFYMPVFNFLASGSGLFFCLAFWTFSIFVSLAPKKGRQLVWVDETVQQAS